MFLVPDHNVSSINGASYEGFYYICADLQNELLDGFYYHHSSTMFQRLDLQFHRDRKFQSFEFR
jgi:glucose-induced degradation protein 4